MSGFGLIGSIGGSIMSHKDNQDALKQQMDMYRQQLAYTKYVQEKTWEREDNAIQRRALDLEKAGINKLMAGGVGGAGAGALMSMPSMPDVAGATNANSAMILNALGSGGAGIDDIIQREKDRNLAKERLEMDRQKTSAEITKMGSEVNKMISDMTTNEFQQALMKSGREVNLEQARKIKMDVEKGLAEINKLDAEIKKIREETKGVKQDNRLKKLEENRKNTFDRLYKEAGDVINGAIDEIQGRENGKKVRKSWWEMTRDGTRKFFGHPALSAGSFGRLSGGGIGF